jgi:hypothetical protein
VARQKEGDEWLDSPSSFGPLESPYAGVWRALDQLDATIAQVTKYAAAIRGDAKVLEQEWHSARASLAMPSTGPTPPSEEVPRGKQWKQRV